MPRSLFPAYRGLNTLPPPTGGEFPSPRGETPIPKEEIAMTLGQLNRGETQNSESRKKQRWKCKATMKELKPRERQDHLDRLFVSSLPMRN